MTSQRAGRIGMGPTSGEDFGLNVIAHHNAVATTEKFKQEPQGPGIYDGYVSAFQDVHNPPTPRSNTTSDGTRTRSGRSAVRHDSPFSTGKSRVSKSPAARSKKEKKSKLDKSKTPRLTAPLSVLTKDMTTPVKDMEAWVNRSAEVRLQETEKRNGYVTRPMNSFMLYRSAYAERTKQWCTQNNHQVVSSVSGESWPMEPQEVRDQFNEWARLERENHQAAHPDYKFSPAKPANKRRKGDFSDDEDDATENNADPDGEYRGGKAVRQRRQPIKQEQSPFLNSTVGFSSNPYFDHQPSGFQQSQYQYHNPGRPMPSNVAYDQAGIPYNPHTGQYLVQPQQYSYSQSIPARTQTPIKRETPRTVGGYGLPSSQPDPVDDMFTNQRCDSPMQSYAQYNSQPSAYQQFGQVYHQLSQQQQYQQQAQQSYEHQQYLQSAARPATAAKPSLESDLMKGVQTPVVQGENQFETAMGEMTSGSSYVNMNFFDEATSPTWSPTTQK